MKKKLNLDKNIIKQAQRYEAAWHKLFFDLPAWRKDAITSEPHGRIADELSHAAANLAESNEKEIKMPELTVSGHNL